MPVPTAGGTAFNGDGIASDALLYAGHAYLYGGAPGSNGANPWDCSSFCNWVLGHDFGLTLPGGIKGYDGSTHGPTTLQYLVWTGAKTIPRKSIQAGDLCVWQTHMGIAINNTQMISAETPANGTRVSTINGAIVGELLVPRRINGISSGAMPLSGSSTNSTNPGSVSVTQTFDNATWEKLGLIAFGALIILVAMTKLGQGGS